MSEATFDLVDVRDPFMDTDWFHHCRQTRTPYVVIRSAESSADVLWDYVTLPPDADERIWADFTLFEREARAIFERFASPDSYLRIKPTQICFDRLALDGAKRAALELYALVETYLSARPAQRTPSLPAGGAESADSSGRVQAEPRERGARSAGRRESASTRV